MRAKGTPLERIRAHTADMGAGCWVTDYAKVAGGYSQVQTPEGLRYVHVVAYEALVGPVPEGYQINHLCEEPGCWKPSDLEAVTPKQNVAYRDRNGHASTRITQCPRGHEYTEENTYRWAKMPNSRQCRACRRERYWVQHHG